MSKNIPKFLSYKEAWRRIKAAKEAGYYFEVVTLCESIISDRLLSYVAGENPSTQASVKTPFSALIRAWKKTAKPLPAVDGGDLAHAVDLWRNERNIVVHGLTKSSPGTATDDLQPFLDRARNAAVEGAKLARAVSAWHQQQLEKKKKSVSNLRTTS